MEIIDLLEPHRNFFARKFQLHLGRKERHDFVEVVAVDFDRFADAARAAREVTRQQYPEGPVRLGSREFQRLFNRLEMNRSKRTCTRHGF